MSRKKKVNTISNIYHEDYVVREILKGAYMH